MSKQNFLHLKPHLVLGEAKVGSNWVNYQRASPGEHLLNRLPQAHITRRRMQLSFGGAKTGIPKMHSFEPCFHQRFQCSKLAWKNQCFRNISARRGIKRTEGEWCWRWVSINVLNSSCCSAHEERGVVVGEEEEEYQCFKSTLKKKSCRF